MLDADERPLSRARLADDERRYAVDAQLARVGEAGGTQPIAAPARGGVERAAIRRLARDPAELGELRREAVAFGRDVPIEIVARGHASSMAAARSP